MKKLYGGAISTGGGSVVYTVPAGYTTEINDIAISNGDGNQAGISIYFVPSGGSISTSNSFLYHYHVDLHGQYTWHGTQVLDPGDFIHVTSDQTDCSIHISGDEYR